MSFWIKCQDGGIVNAYSVDKIYVEGLSIVCLGKGVYEVLGKYKTKAICEEIIDNIMKEILDGKKGYYMEEENYF